MQELEGSESLYERYEYNYTGGFLYSTTVVAYATSEQNILLYRKFLFLYI